MSRGEKECASTDLLFACGKGRRTLRGSPRGCRRRRRERPAPASSPWPYHSLRFCDWSGKATKPKGRKVLRLKSVGTGDLPGAVENLCRVCSTNAGKGKCPGLCFQWSASVFSDSPNCQRGHTHQLRCFDRSSGHFCLGKVYGYRA